MEKDVVNFIENKLHRDLSNKDILKWCDDNIFELSKIYEKYRGTTYSYVLASHVLFFTHSVYEHDDMINMIKTFVKYQ